MSIFYAINSSVFNENLWKLCIFIYYVNNMYILPLDVLVCLKVFLCINYFNYVL